MPKNLVREPFDVSLISGMERIFASEGYVTIFDFLLNFFCLIVPKIFVDEPSVLYFTKFLVVKSLCVGLGWSTKIFRRKLFVSQCRGIS